MAPPKHPSKPCLHDLSYRGFIEGVTVTDASSGADKAHFFGGIPYALPPVGPFRWRRPRELPPCYRYGTRSNPGRFNGGCAICPQPSSTDKPPRTALWDEDCLQLNIWVPAGHPPSSDGWPVIFYLHGGFLQFGSPNSFDGLALLSETTCKAVVVAPAYRLNLFGFLASPSLTEPTDPHSCPSNVGFWDQRLALEWTHKNISYFGADASNIALMGYSAGAFSAFHQLAHDMYLPPSRRIVRRALLLSNGPGVAPKALHSTEIASQFTSLLQTLNIPTSLSPAQIMARLREVPAEQLILASSKIPQHQFRPVADNAFIPSTLFADIDSGVFSQRLAAAKISIVLGDMPDEHFMYATHRPPSPASFTALEQRLSADYPSTTVRALLRKVYLPNGEATKFPARVAGAEVASWREAFGRIYADLQIHALQRGFVDRLVRDGAGEYVRRYRIEWRAKCVDEVLPVKWGVTHTSDLLGIWVFGEGRLSQEEGVVVRNFAGPIWEWLCGGSKEAGEKGSLFGWDEGADGSGRKARCLRSDGSVSEGTDGDFGRGVDVWEVARAAALSSDRVKASL